MKKFLLFVLSLAMVLGVSVSSVAASDTYINVNFESAEEFSVVFKTDETCAYFVEDGLLFGYSEAKALQTKYKDSQDLFEDTDYTWLTYDATATMALAADELSNHDRWINLVYCNDNLFYNGRLDKRLYMCFAYDIQESCFRLSASNDGYTPFNNNIEEDQLLPPVYMDINTDGEEFFTLGISVEKDRLRCFYNGELIFDFVDTDNEYYIAHDITSPFLLWQDGNFIQISNVTVAEAGSIFPSAISGDANGDGKVNIADASLILKKIAGWEVSLDEAAADVTGDDKVNLADVSLILKYIAGWDVNFK